MKFTLNWIKHIFIFVTLEIDKITFEEFKKLLPKVWKDENPEKELRNAFDVFDPTNNGFFTPDQLRKFLMGFGENLDENDFKDFMKSITVQPDDTINVEGSYCGRHFILILNYSCAKFFYFYFKIW